MLPWLAHLLQSHFTHTLWDSTEWCALYYCHQLTATISIQWLLYMRNSKKDFARLELELELYEEAVTFN